MPHLVITDIRMPVMDGLQLAKNIYLMYPSIKVVIVSGFNDFEFAQQAIEYEVKDYLTKPVTAERLVATLVKIRLQLDAELDSLVNSARSTVEAGTPETIIDALKLYLRENYSRSVKLQDIAAALNFNPDYISRLFKKHTGESPIRYLTSLRINEAKRLLATCPEMDIGRIGCLVGYPDPYYFSRVFKQRTGLSPSEYRQITTGR